MGSGSNGGYGGSQDYAESYHVVEPALAKDKKDPDIYDPKKGYFKNPTATVLEDAEKGNRIYVDGKKQGGKLTYVMDTDGNIIIGKRQNPNDSTKRCPHPTLIGGKDPKVQCAGMITFEKGRILSVNTNSGHYKPNRKSLEKINDALQKLCNKNPNLFSPNSKWRKNK